MKCSAVDLAEVIDRLNDIFGSADHTAEGVGVAAEILGGAVKHQVGAKLERVLVDRCGKRIINDHGRSDRVGALRESLDIHDLASWVGRTFQIEHPATLIDLGFDSVEIGGIAEGRLDFESGKELVEDFVRAAIGVAHRDHAVART